MVELKYIGDFYDLPSDILVLKCTVTMDGFHSAALHTRKGTQLDPVDQVQENYL